MWRRPRYHHRVCDIVLRRFCCQWCTSFSGWLRNPPPESVYCARTKKGRRRRRRRRKKKTKNEKKVADLAESKSRKRTPCLVPRASFFRRIYGVDARCTSVGFSDAVRVRAPGGNFVNERGWLAFLVAHSDSVVFAFAFGSLSQFSRARFVGCTSSVLHRCLRASGSDRASVSRNRARFGHSVQSARSGRSGSFTLDQIYIYIYRVIFYYLFSSYFRRVSLCCVREN